MNSLRYLVVWILTLSYSNASSAFSPLFSSRVTSSSSSSSSLSSPWSSHAFVPSSIIPRSLNKQPRITKLQQVWKIARGGEQAPSSAEGVVEEQEAAVTDATEKASDTTTTDTRDRTIPGSSVTEPVATTATSSAAMMFVGIPAAMGRFYTHQLDILPIFTKSWTAGVIFGLSDYIAQKIEATPSSPSDGKKETAKTKTQKKALDGKRLLGSTLVGLLYFGPAAHYWYETIFRLLPGSSLWSTIQKAFWGQVIFGPSFTCIFFAAALLQSGQFSLSVWWQKIRSDLPGAWLAGIGFWPIVDFISYSMVPPKWIPLFINMCSLVWTVYLSLVANKAGNQPSKK